MTEKEIRLSVLINNERVAVLNQRIEYFKEFIKKNQQSITTKKFRIN